MHESPPEPSPISLVRHATNLPGHFHLLPSPSNANAPRQPLAREAFVLERLVRSVQLPPWPPRIHRRHHGTEDEPGDGGADAEMDAGAELQGLGPARDVESQGILIHDGVESGRLLADVH